MIRTELTPRQKAVEALNDARDKATAAGIGEPCVEIPIEFLSTYKTGDGEMKVIITITHLAYVVDSTLRD